MADAPKKPKLTDAERVLLWLEDYQMRRELVEMNGSKCGFKQEAILRVYDRSQVSQHEHRGSR